MKYVLKGRLKIGEKFEKFTKAVDAKDGPEARELTLSLFGSEHGTKRRHIQIDTIEKSKE